MHNIVPNDCIPSSNIRSCHRVKPGLKHRVSRLPLERQMAVLLPAELAIRDNAGKHILGGLLAFQRKVESDRLINDRRPLNCLEHRLGWAKLPHGCPFLSGHS